MLSQLYRCFVGLFLVGALATPAIANIKTVEDSQAQNEPTNISVIRGKSASINFKNDEAIIHIKLSDLSNNVYSLDAPIESGEARSLYLSQIETLDIEGATTTIYPNLYVTTVDAQGKQQEYEFIIHNHSQGDSGYRVAIRPTPPPPPPKPKPIPKPQNTIQTELGEATPTDIALGLDISIRNNRISKSDPLVAIIREYVAMTLNGSTTAEAAKDHNLPLSIIQKLGSLGLQEDVRRRLLPLPNPVTFGESTKAIRAKKQEQ